MKPAEAKEIAAARGWSFKRGSETMEMVKGGRMLAWDSRYPGERWSRLEVVLVEHLLALEGKGIYRDGNR